MTVEQIKELSRSKWVTIGSHGYYHNDLSQIGMDLVRDELARSKRFLENITDKEVYALAFPYGAYSPDTVQVAKDVGYTQLLTTGRLFPEKRRRSTVTGPVYR